MTMAQEPPIEFSGGISLISLMQAISPKITRKASILVVGRDDQEMFSIEDDGRIILRGKVIAEDRELAQAFWLTRERSDNSQASNREDERS